MVPLLLIVVQLFLFTAVRSERLFHPDDCTKRLEIFNREVKQHCPFMEKDLLPAPPPSTTITVGTIRYRRCVHELAKPERAGLLWTGFWDGDPHASMNVLKSFATATDSQTLHPDTHLGQLMDKSGILKVCDSEVLNPLWATASDQFASHMRYEWQKKVVVLINKKLHGERPLLHSVFYQFELYALAFNHVGYLRTQAGPQNVWQPDIQLIDLQGTCTESMPFLQKSFKNIAESFGFVFNFKPEKWSCEDCPSGCSLLDPEIVALGRQP
ncbi:ANKK1 [Symbiodinium sp. CCMP2592]|nr:ANKK1 [Symbiodinium sp. CCMP2592]